MEENAPREISRQAEPGLLTVSDLIQQLVVQEDDLPDEDTSHKELCIVTDPTTVSQEPNTVDLCDTEQEMLGIEDLQLDVNTASNLLDISTDCKIASRSKIHRNRPETPERFQWPQVLSSQSFSSGQRSWAVVSGRSRSWIVGMCYPSIARKQWQSVVGNNSKSWCLARSGNQYLVIHDKEERWLPGNVSSNKVRIYLDYGAGEISFYELCDPRRHLHTFTASFSEALHAALCVWEGCMNTSRTPNVCDVQEILDVTENPGLLLDVDTACNKLVISHDKRTASWSYHQQNRPNMLKSFHHPQVLSCQGFSLGQHHWEVDVGASESWRVGMCYPSIDRKEWQSNIGSNYKSWCLVRQKNHYFTIHNSNKIRLPVKISTNQFRIFLDYEAGQLSFYALSEPIRHLHTFTATFTEPLHAALWVRFGCISISGGSYSEASQQTMEPLEEAEILLDKNTANNLVAVSDDGKRASWTFDSQSRPETPKRFQFYPQVLSSQSFCSGRYYWEVDVRSSYSWRVGMCYPSMDRVGRPGSVVGNNDQSWALDMDGPQYLVRHSGNTTELSDHISSDRVRIYLDYEAGQLSFYELRDPIRHLHTFTATFTEPLHAIVCVWEGWITISGGRSVDVSDL